MGLKGSRTALRYGVDPERNVPPYTPGVEPSIQTAPAAFA
jgi:hypothetical protein